MATFLAVIGFVEENTPQKLVLYRYPSEVREAAQCMAGNGPYTPVVKASFKLSDGGCLMNLDAAYHLIQDSILPESGFTQLENDWWHHPDKYIISITHRVLQTIATVSDGSMDRLNGENFG